MTNEKQLNYTVFIEKIKEKNEEIERLKEEIKIYKEILRKGKNRAHVNMGRDKHEL